MYTETCHNCGHEQFCVPGQSVNCSKCGSTIGGYRKEPQEGVRTVSWSELLGPEIAVIEIERLEDQRFPRIRLRKGKDWGTGLMGPVLFELRLSRRWPWIGFARPARQPS